MRLLAKRGEQICENLSAGDSQKFTIHLIATGSGFKWKITESKIVQEGPILKWKGIGKPFMFMLGDNNPEIREKLDKYLDNAGLSKEVKALFNNKMENVRDEAIERWRIRYISKERE